MRHRVGVPGVPGASLRRDAFAGPTVVLPPDLEHEPEVGDGVVVATGPVFHGLDGHLTPAHDAVHGLERRDAAPEVEVLVGVRTVRGPGSDSVAGAIDNHQVAEALVQVPVPETERHALGPGQVLDGDTRATTQVPVCGPLARAEDPRRLVAVVRERRSAEDDGEDERDELDEVFHFV